MRWRRPFNENDGIDQYILSNGESHDEADDTQPRKRRHARADEPAHSHEHYGTSEHPLATKPVGHPRPRGCTDGEPDTEADE